MSTKALRECLEYMREQHGSGMMEDAKAELDAIEKAIGDVVVTLDTPFKVPHGDWQKTCAFLRAVAGEASKRQG